MRSRWTPNFLIAITATGAIAAGELPEFYRRVDQIVWVVQDLDQTWRQAQKLPFVQMSDWTEVWLPASTFRGQPASGQLRVALGWFADTRTVWIQPLDGQNAFREFAQRHGSGIFSLMHRVKDETELDKELERLASQGVSVLQEVSWQGSARKFRYVWLDTESQGKYVLGLFWASGEDPGGESLPPSPQHRIAQYAFVVRDLEPVSAYWARLGFPAMTYTQTPLRDRLYRGQPADFEMRLGWQRHGQVPYEWILSLRGPDIYREHLERHGEGVHHLAFQVDDMDQAIAEWEKAGFPVIMSGAWGQKDQPGSGRFAYVDAERLGGIAIELLWNYRGK